MNEQIREPTATELVLLQRAEAAEAEASRFRVLSEQIERAKEAAEAEAESLRTALSFYADRDTWKGEFPERPIDKDCDGDFVAVSGKRARAALSNEPDKTAEARQAVVDAVMNADENYLPYSIRCARDRLAMAREGGE